MRADEREPESLPTRNVFKNVGSRGQASETIDRQLPLAACLGPVKVFNKCAPSSTVIRGNPDEEFCEEGSAFFGF